MPGIVAASSSPAGQKSGASAKTCFKCGKPGHVGKDCKGPAQKAATGGAAPAKGNTNTKAKGVVDVPEETLRQELADPAATEAKKAEAAKKADAPAPAKAAEADKNDGAAADKARFTTTPGSVAANMLVCKPEEFEAEMALLTTFLADVKDQKGRNGCVQVLSALVAGMNASSEPLVISVFPKILGATADKDKKVREAAEKAALSMCESIHVHSLIPVVDTLLIHLEGEIKFQTKLVSLKCLEIFASRAAPQMKSYLHKVIPAMHLVLWDTHPDVESQAGKTLLVLFEKMVSNKDLEPFLPALISSINHLDEVPECIQRLASTTFVQTVDRAALSVIVPLMVRGFRERKPTVHRQASVIISNMVKLVEHPQEAGPFLEELVQNLNSSGSTMSDPEARGVIQKTEAQLIKMQDAIAKGPKPLHVEELEKEISAATGGAGSALARTHIAHMCKLLVECREVSAFKKEIGPVVMGLPTTADKVDALDVLMQKYEKAQLGEEEEDDSGEEKLCDTVFTLAYGSKVLLHNTKLKLTRGHRYGLLGGNDSGKSTLMRAIANGQLDGFPPASEVRTVFVEADIQGELSHLNNLEYIFADHRIRALDIERDEIATIMKSVGFTDKMLKDNVSTLSGGWRMKLALSRAMLQKADVLLLDEPTNHLDVHAVAWVQQYLNSLSTTTSVIVSHDKSMLDNCCTDILVIENLRLLAYKGNLSKYTETHPEANSFFELKASKFKFTFPQPNPIPGIKSRGKPLLKMDHVNFTYPINDKPTLTDITVRVSMASRVGCVGVNGAGKSTMVKLLTGELVATEGIAWKHEAVRVAYVAQHAFHHIEQHLNKTANEYIRWRYEGGEDKESLAKATLILTEEDEAKLAIPTMRDGVDSKGNTIKVKRVFDRLTGARRPVRKEFEYEVAWQGVSLDYCEWLTGAELTKLGAEKHVKYVDIKVEAAAGSFMEALTSANVEKHIEAVGLEREYATHNRIAALSGGQKVKVVLAAAMWAKPHILILDEPTNYLDRDSLGALAEAIDLFEGGVVIISHNDQFVSTVCKEHWVMENGKLDVKGDAEWMKNQDTEIKYTALDTMVDAAGNTIKVKAPKVKMSRQEKKNYDKLKKAARARGEEVSSDEE